MRFSLLAHLRLPARLVAAALVFVDAAAALAQSDPAVVAYCAKKSECDGDDVAACERDQQAIVDAATGTSAADCLAYSSARLAFLGCLGAQTCEGFASDATCVAEGDAFGALNSDVGSFCEAGNAPPDVPGWNCPRSFFDAEDGCDCGCGVADPDCGGNGVGTAGQGVGVAACEFCYGVDGTQLPGDAGTCVASQCGGVDDGERCDGGRRIVCVDGAVDVEEDCLTRGEVCLASGGSASCVLAAPECGAAGIGVCTGTVATICEGGQLSTTVDCATLGRRCGATSEGPIGCVTGAPGEGEGEEGEGEEGEGEEATECVDDSDCDDDEECDDGQCERVRSRGAGNDVAEPPPSLISCATAPPSLFAVVLLALGRRRRR